MAAIAEPHQGEQTRLRRAASDPALLATDLADYLVRKGMAFRPAASRRGRGGGAGGKDRQAAEQLTLAELQGVGQNLWPRRAGRVQPANRDGETEPDRRTGNEGKSRSNWHGGGNSFREMPLNISIGC